MRILWGAVLVVAACGPKHSAPAKDFTLHDKVLVEADGAIVAIDATTGVVVPVTSGEVTTAIWAGRCVVYIHGEGELSVVDPVTDKRWDLDDSAGERIVASADGTHVSWDCTDDDGAAAVCATIVDGSGDVEVVTDPLPAAGCWPNVEHQICTTDRGLRIDDAAEAYLDAGALYVTRGDAPATKISDGPIARILDWRP